MSILLTTLSLLLGCSVFYPTIKIQVPKGYIGWCYVLPVSDTSKIISSDNEYYRIDSNGVAYVPSSVLKLENDNIINVFEDRGDITSKAQYMGRVENTIEGKKYEYISFYLPSYQERNINDDKYWRKKGYEYDKIHNLKFDSLLKKNKIKFD